VSEDTVFSSEVSEEVSSTEVTEDAGSGKKIGDGEVENGDGDRETTIGVGETVTGVGETVTGAGETGLCIPWSSKHSLSGETASSMP
jgi:hypothetical protein